MLLLLIPKITQTPLSVSDPKLDTTLTIDGATVTVPQGKPVHQSKFAGSSFSQSEYLIYKESQNRIRYLLLMEFSYWTSAQELI